MTELSQPQKLILMALYREAEGQMGRFFPITSGDRGVLETLFYDYKLVELLMPDEEDGGEWEVALTEFGCEVASELIQEYTLGIKLDFDISKPNEAALVERLGQLAEQGNGDLNALLGQLFMLHEALDRGDFEALIAAYPAARDTIRQLVRAGVDSQLMTYEQQRMEELSEEVRSMKAMLSERPLTKDEPAPMLKPIMGLKPVQPVPEAPYGQPQQIQAPVFDVPQYDEEEDSALFVVRKDEDAGRRASANFLQSLLKLQD